ncbi:MAG: preprotein translocase subunit SecY [Candidatus Nealsonbacteria bacterium]|nr:MAG: preprotein translocase subunit SecY [Candidatus Nealsonbacteria bacterium]
MWYNAIIQIFKAKDLRNKILFVLGIFVIFRVMANIPIPGIDPAKIKEFFGQFQLLGLMNIFTGGALERFSIIMLGLGPYITATIILQLLTMIFPKLEEMYKEEGEEGRRKFEQYGRILTMPLAILQSFGMLTLFSRQGLIGEISPLAKISSIVTVTAGSIFLMWLGELISEKGIGNGVSLLIFAGIIADFPRNLGQLIAIFQEGKIPFYLILVFFAASLLIIAGVTIINEARRNIPVSYAKRVRGRMVYGGASTYLPLSVNPAGVIPIIFALSILTFPSMIANFLLGSEGFWGIAAQGIIDFFNNPWLYGILYFILIFLFTYFYTLITFEPDSVAENLKKMGGFVPGIRPGKSTAKYLNFILNRILPIGALFLALIALMPSIIQGMTKITAFSFLIGGTSIIIIVSVVLETIKQIQAQLEMREYDTF